MTNKQIYHSSLVHSKYYSEYIKLASTSSSFDDWYINEELEHGVLNVVALWKENY